MLIWQSHHATTRRVGSGFAVSPRFYPEASSASSSQFGFSSGPHSANSMFARQDRINQLECGWDRKLREFHPEKRLISYARVSTYGQTLDSQLEQLRKAGCASRNIYREKVTGARADRCELNRMLGKLAPGDVVTVTRIDRLARSTGASTCATVRLFSHFVHAWYNQSGQNLSALQIFGVSQPTPLVFGLLGRNDRQKRARHLVPASKVPVINHRPTMGRFRIRHRPLNLGLGNR
jgi:Resolvase, N terminal domain